LEARSCQSLRLTIRIRIFVLRPAGPESAIHPSLLREDLPEAIERLSEQPESGEQIRCLPAEVRKVRLGVRQQNLGSRGAYRLIYRVDRTSNVLQLLALYYKPEIPDMSSRTIEARLSRI
jgi:hypothetical protein